MSLLDPHEILKIHAAIVSAGLLESRGALLSGVGAAFVGGIALASNPRDQVLHDLDALNAAETLADGRIPLVTWLNNAVGLGEARIEVEVFKAAIDRCSSREARGAGQPSVVHHRASGAEVEPETVTVRLFNVAAAEEWTLRAAPAMTVLQLIGAFKDMLRARPWNDRGVPKPGFGYTVVCFASGTDAEPLPYETTLSNLLKDGEERTISLNIGWYRLDRGDAKVHYK